MEGKILNPVTGRWVLKTGATGKALLKKIISTTNPVAKENGSSPGKQQNPKKEKPANEKNEDIQNKVQHKVQEIVTKLIKAQNVDTQNVDTQNVDRLFFYNASADVAPGRGAHEHVADKDNYATLSKIRDWRKVLSNFHICPFKYNALTYRSIEHAFQAEKIRLVDKNAAYTFSVESGTALGMGDGLAARKARKLVNLDKDKIREWDAMSRGIMKRIAEAKYQQCPEARHVLKATNNAELWHLVMRSKTHDHFTHLEEIRSTL